MNTSPILRAVAKKTGRSEADVTRVIDSKWRLRVLVYITAWVNSKLSAPRRLK